MAAAAPAVSSRRDESTNVPVRKECSVPGKAVYVMWRVPFMIDEKYVPIKAIGKGAFGVVCSAKNHLTGDTVAIKKIANFCDNLIDARRTLREIRLLQQLVHENIIKMKDVMLPPPGTRNTFTDLYIVYELMDTDLHQIIRSGQRLSNEHMQYFIYQVLRGLKYMHSANVLHRDLKPGNLLVNANCDLKICDLGLARVSSELKTMTEYVVTRWYRAPELLLSNKNYTAAVDMWSVGCILAELLNGRAFMPGEDYVDQLKLIISTLGSPKEDELSFIVNNTARSFIRALPFTGNVDLRARFPRDDPLAIDLLEQMLQFDPRKRINVEQALEHPWLASLHDEAAEPSAHVVFEQQDVEDAELDEPSIRELIYQECLRFAEKNRRMV